MTVRFSKCILGAVATLAIAGYGSAPVQAGVLHKHPTAAGVAAGLAVHHMAKKSARTGHHGLIARHPKAAGVAAGLAAHHMLKHH